MSMSRIVDGPGFRIRYDGQPGYLRAHVYDGTDSLQVSMAMWRMLGEECRVRAATRLLVLEELQGTVDTVNSGQIIDAMVEAGFIGVRIAFVELLDDIQGNEVAETLCLERGIITRIFSEENTARRWLLYGD